MDLFRVTTAGSVDDGKSTLIGRLLFDSQSLYDDQIEALEADFDLAKLTDGLRAERAQGITIDVAYRYFSTPRRRFVIADSPGHVRYTRNMVTAASSAQLLVLLVDATRGVTEQTRRHAYLAGLLRIPRVLVAVNKMDRLGFDEAPFRAIEADLRGLQTRWPETLGDVALEAIPTSALDGDNVVARSTRAPWYAGPSLLSRLESAPSADRDRRAAGRLFVQGVLRVPGGARPARRYLGQVAAGRLRVGEEITVLPSGETTRIEGLHTYDGPLDEATTHQSVAVSLADDVDVDRGDLLAARAGAPTPAQRLNVTAFWMGDRALRPGAKLLLRHGTRALPCRVTDIEHRLDLTSLGPVPATDGLEANDVGRLRLQTAAPIPVDRFRDVGAGGRLVLVDPHTQDTVAAAVVEAAA